ncbi:Nn.00g059180.m01.CDS01 [Neocucurbitaria sp. VM-36]
MAEGLAAAGAAASILQIIQIGVQVVERIRLYSVSCSDLPEAFKHVGTELPVITVTLQRIDMAAKLDHLDQPSKDALDGASVACKREVEELQKIVFMALPEPGATGLQRTWKAIGSLRYDDKVKKKMDAIRGYVHTLNFNITVYSATGSLTVPISTPPLPGAVGLSRPDPNFVYRPVLDEVLTRSLNPGSRSALVGIGGIGKSQLAIEYAHRVRNDRPDTWVFWVRGATIAKFEDSYRAIARAVDIPGYKDKKTNILQTVHEWLSNESNGKWVMVVDNADDMDVWTTAVPPMSDRQGNVGQQNAPRDSTAVRLLSFVPESRNGAILVTSRNREVARLLTGSYPQILQVDEMEELEAIELFNKKSGGGHEPTEVATLVKKLDYIPLAISQAASHIAERAGRMTITQYTNELANLDQRALKLLEASIDESHRDKERTNSIIATWMISFRHIYNTMPSVARLLSLMCLFDRQGIPEDLLVGQYAPPEPIPKVMKISWWKRRRRFQRKKVRPANPDSLKPDNNFERDYIMLNNYSLIKTDNSGTHFEMHRLVQLTTKRWLELQSELQFWMERYITILHAAYPWPEDSADDWAKCKTLFPHALMAKAYQPIEKTFLQDWCLLLQNAAASAHERGLFQDAEDLNRTALKAWETSFGKDHPNTLRLLSNLGTMLLSLGQLQEAEKIHRHVFSVRERLHGPDNEETLKSAYTFALVLYDLGKLEEAERLYRRVLEGREKTYGITARETRFVVLKLMSTLSSLGRQEESDALMMRAFPSDLNAVR